MKRHICEKCGGNIKDAEKNDCPVCMVKFPVYPKTDTILVGTKKQLMKYFHDTLLAPHDFIEGYPGVKGEYKSLLITDQLDSILSSRYPLGMVFYLEKVRQADNEFHHNLTLVKSYVHVREENE